MEGTKVDAEEKSHGISTSGNFGCCLLVLICIGLCCMFTMFVSAAVWDQAFGFGKEKEGRKGLKKLEKKKRKEKMMDGEEKKIEEEQQEEVEEIPQLMRDIVPPSEPALTESGQGTMETRLDPLCSTRKLEELPLWQKRLRRKPRKKPRQFRLKPQTSERVKEVELKKWKKKVQKSPQIFCHTHGSCPVPWVC